MQFKNQFMQHLTTALSQGFPFRIKFTAIIARCKWNIVTHWKNFKADSIRPQFNSLKIFGLHTFIHEILSV